MKIIHIISEPNIHSQLRVAQELIKYSKHPILLEDLSENRSEKDIDPIISDFAKNIFYNGIPKFNELTDLQANLLLKLKAALILLSLKIIQSLYKSISKEAEKTLKTVEHSKQEIQNIKSLQAIKRAEEAATTHFEKIEDTTTVIMVFSSAYNFKPYCDKVKFQHEIIDTTTVSIPPMSLDKKLDTELDSKHTPLTLQRSSPKSAPTLNLQQSREETLKEYVEKKHISQVRLDELKKTKSWLVDAICQFHICQAIKNRSLTIDLLDTLDKDIVDTFVETPNKEQLKTLIAIFSSPTHTKGPSL